MKAVLSVIFALFLSSCNVNSVSEVTKNLEERIFEMTGVMLFTAVEEPSLKDLLLTGVEFDRTRVLVRGQVTEVSKHSTFAVIKDDYASLLVLLTELEPEKHDVVQAAKRKGTFSLLGEVRPGKKGLPLFVAKRVFHTNDADVPSASSQKG